MERILRYLERLIPQSAFGVTLLTITVMILVVGFFVGGIELASVHFDGTKQRRRATTWPGAMRRRPTIRSASARGTISHAGR